MKWSPDWYHSCGTGRASPAGHLMRFCSPARGGSRSSNIMTPSIQVAKLLEGADDAEVPSSVVSWPTDYPGQHLPLSIHNRKLFRLAFSICRITAACLTGITNALICGSQTERVQPSLYSQCVLPQGFDSLFQMCLLLTPLFLQVSHLRFNQVNKLERLG